MLAPGFVIEFLARSGGWLVDLIWLDRGLSAEAILRARMVNWKYFLCLSDLGRNVVLSKPDQIRISCGVTIRNSVVIVPGGQGYCEIGEGTHISHHSVLAASGGIAIGRNCAISSGVIIYSITNGRASDERPLNDSPVIVAPVNIGNDVHIGANVTILPGVTVGNRAVLGAGSVVTKNVLANTTVVGVPAKEINYR